MDQRAYAIRLSQKNVYIGNEIKKNRIEQASINDTATVFVFFLALSGCRYVFKSTFLGGAVYLAPGNCILYSFCCKSQLSANAT